MVFSRHGRQIFPFSLYLIMSKKMSDGLKLLLPTLTEAWHRSYTIHNNWLKFLDKLLEQFLN